MPYLIRGSFKNIFAAFGRDFFSSDGSNIEDLRRDLERSPLLGTPDQCKTHIETWMDPELSDHEHYSQGNMFGEILKMLLGADVYTHPLKLANEQPEEAAKNIGKLDFGFIDHAGQLAAFHLEYRKDKPGQWLAGIIKNTNKIPEEREVIFISSFKPKVVDSKQGIEVVNVESGPIPLIGTKDKPLVHNPLVRNLVQSIIQKNGEVHPDSSIANQFTQIVSEKAYQPNERLLASLHKNVGKALANPGLKILEQLDLDTYKVPHLEKCLNQSKPFFQHLLALGKLKDKALARDKGILLLFLDSLNLLETYSQHKNAVWLPALADYIKRDLLGSSSQDVLLNISHVSRLWSMLSKSLSDNSKATIIDAFLRSSKSLGIEKILLNIQNEDEAKVILNRIRNGESELQLFLDEMHRYEHLAGVLVNLSSSVSIQEFRKIATTPAIHEAYFLLQKNNIILPDNKILLDPVQFEQLNLFISELKTPDADKIARVEVMLWLSYQKRFDYFTDNQDNNEYLQLLQQLFHLHALDARNLDESLHKVEVFLKDIRPEILKQGKSHNVRSMAMLIQCYLNYPGDKPLLVLPRLLDETQIRLFQYLIKHENNESLLIALVDQLQTYPGLAGQLWRMVDRGESVSGIIKIGTDPALSLLQSENVAFKAEGASELTPFVSKLQEITRTEPNAALRKSFLEAALVLAKDNSLKMELLNPRAQLQRKTLADLQHAVPGNEDYLRLAAGDDSKSHDFNLILQQIFSRQLPASGQKLLIEAAYTALNNNKLDSLQADSPEKKRLAKPLGQMRTQMQLMDHFHGLQLEQKYLDLLMGQDTNSQRFFNAAVFVETQCEEMRKRLLKTNPAKHNLMLEHEANYRKALYSILYDGLTSPAGSKNKNELSQRLRDAEQPLLSVLDVDSRPALRRTMKVIANFFSILLIGIPNMIHHRRTGHWAFFDRTRSSETVSTVSEKVRKEIESPSPKAGG